MACYHPIEAYQSQSGGPLSFRETKHHDKSVDIPCGRCVGCRLEYSRQWAVRCLHESKCHKWSWFLTLTYDDDKVPALGSLSRADPQLFLKRLRRHFSEEPTRFFGCGEYGEATSRPHYHLLIFGPKFTDLRTWSDSKHGRLWTSATLDKLWTHGRVLVGEMTFKSAAYVARYSLKKVTGDLAKIHYRVLDTSTGEVGSRLPEFAMMSRRPGIGAEFYRRFRSDIYPRGRVVVNAREAPPPRFYDKRYAVDDPIKFEELQIKKELDIYAKRIDNSWERLAVKEEVAKARLTFKRRNLT